MAESGAKIIRAGWWVAVIVFVSLSTSPGVGLAQEEGDEVARSSNQRKSLAQRIPAVSRRFFQRSGRLEVAPRVGLSLNDAFFNHLIVGGGLSYSVLESLAVGISGEYYLSFDESLQISGGGAPAPPNFNGPVYAARFETIWTPFYGKLSILAEKIIHMDTYLAAGVGVVGTDQTSSVLAGSVTLGQRFYLNEWMAIKIELRDQIFKMARNPAMDRSKDLQNLLTATVGICFYLPSAVEPSSL